MRVAAVWTGVVLLATMAAGPGAAQTAGAPAAETAEMRDLVEAVRQGAKASRDTADHARVVPDILTQILAKLDKIEDKLARIEEATKTSAAAARRAPASR